jgi:hypothetical protein
VDPTLPEGLTVDIETRPRMTVEDIALMREIVRWRRANGINYVPDWSRYRASTRDGSSVAWTTLDIPRDDPMVGVTHDYLAPYEWHRVHSFREAVDLIVALGFLPQRFSSAYRAGWHASHVWHDASAEFPPEEFERLFHDPENISFPAGGEDL